MNVLSLFDGMSCGQIALNRAGIAFNNYYSSEIKKSAIMLTSHHFPKTIFLGDIHKIDLGKLPKIDLLIGGSPCQDFSIMKANRKNLQGEKSKLFYKFLEIKELIKPTYFLLENVKMNKDSESQLNKYIGVS